MKSKRIVISLLVLVNIFLAIGLIAMGGNLPQALAQNRSGGAKYLAVTGTFVNDIDALYILHAQKGQLVVLTPDFGQPGKMTIRAIRDISGDLSN